MAIDDLHYHETTTQEELINLKNTLPEAEEVMDIGEAPSVEFFCDDQTGKRRAKLKFSKINALITYELTISINPETNEVFILPLGISNNTFTYTDREDFIIKVSPLINAKSVEPPDRPNLRNEVGMIFDTLTNETLTNKEKSGTDIALMYNSQNNIATCHIGQTYFTVTKTDQKTAAIKVNNSPIQNIAFTDENDFNRQLGPIIDTYYRGNVSMRPNLSHVGIDICSTMFEIKTNNANTQQRPTPSRGMKPNGTQVTTQNTTPSQQSAPTQNNNIDIPTTDYTDFANYLQAKTVDNLFDKRTDLGKFLNTMRFYDNIKTAADKHGVPFEYLFILAMVEGQGDQYAINPADGGAGIGQFQPDVAERDFEAITFTGHDADRYTNKGFVDYSIYSYDNMEAEQIKIQNTTASKINKTSIYSKHGNLLSNLKKTDYIQKDMSQLAKRDDRFDVDRCLNASAEYLYEINTYSVTKQMTKEGANRSDHEKRMYALNGYNKGPSRFKVDFWPKGDDDHPHMKNIRRSLGVYQTRMNIITTGIENEDSNETIFSNLK